jgi:hypothetical protein
MREGRCLGRQTRSKQTITRETTMSTIVKFVAPSGLLFQPVQRERVSARSECEGFWLQSIPASEERFWNLPGQAVSSRAAMIELLVLVLFAVISLVGVISCFAELSHLLGSDAIGQVAAKVVSAGS